MEYLTNGQQFPMVCTLIDHRNDINIFKTMQCSTYVWNILMLHVFLWLIRVQTMENCFRYVFYHNTDSFDIYFYWSISQNREEKCDVMLPWKHYFWMTTKPMTMAVARRMAKNVYINKQQLCTCITLFCTFLCRRCTATTWNFLMSRARFMK